MIVFGCPEADTSRHNESARYNIVALLEGFQETLMLRGTCLSDGCAPDHSYSSRAERFVFINKFDIN